MGLLLRYAIILLSVNTLLLVVLIFRPEPAPEVRIIEVPKEVVVKPRWSPLPVQPDKVEPEKLKLPCDGFLPPRSVVHTVQPGGDGWAFILTARERTPCRVLREVSSLQGNYHVIESNHLDIGPGFIALVAVGVVEFE